MQDYHHLDRAAKRPTGREEAAALPERLDLIIGGERPAARRIDGGALLLAQAIDPGAPRFDLAGKLGKLLLVLGRPGRHPLQNVFDRWAHGKDVAQNAGDFHGPLSDVGRSPGEAQRNPGSINPFPDFASLHPGYLLNRISIA